MVAGDLMVGDWVSAPYTIEKRRNIQVEEIICDEINPCWDGMENYGGIKIEYLEPIPLTQEILEKNGWHEPKNAWMVLREGCNELNILLGEHYTEVEYMNMAYNPEDPDEVNYGSSFEFPRAINVHELQHIMKFCEFEKEIVL